MKQEWEAADQYPAGAEAGALRVWTTKEAVSKALDRPLPETWTTAEVVNIGAGESLVRVDAKDQTVFHAELEDHLMTIFLSRNSICQKRQEALDNIPVMGDDN